jgi:hypothetical protein
MIILLGIQSALQWNNWAAGVTYGPSPQLTGECSHSLEIEELCIGMSVVFIYFVVSKETMVPLSYLFTKVLRSEVSANLCG